MARRPARRGAPMTETLLSPSNVLLFGRVVTDLQIVTPAANPRHSPFPQNRVGIAGEVEQQLVAANATFARIYGFSFEGFYYDLPQPALFLVHGPGVAATEAIAAIGAPHRARAPAEPSLSGVGAADFQIADDIMVWSYDKADYTVRMDVQSGMFEQVLLDVQLGGGFDARGANLRGANVRGANVRGANVRGANVRGGGNSD
jgi:Pentapeptide repeats (8 copies)